MKELLKKALPRTLLLALSILLIGGCLLFLLRALLPDHIGIYREYDLSEQDDPQVSPDRELPILYPWTELTEPYTLPDGEAFSFEVLLSELGLPQVSYDPGKVSFLQNKQETLFGISELRVWLSVLEDDNGLLATTREYTLSLAFDTTEGALCSLLCLPTAPSPYDVSAWEAAYARMTAQAQDPFSKEKTPFADFASWYTPFLPDAEKRLPALLYNLWDITQVGRYLLFSYELDGCSLTLVADPLAGRILGFSMNRNGMFAIEEAIS